MGPRRIATAITAIALSALLGLSVLVSPTQAEEPEGQVDRADCSDYTMAETGLQG